VRSWLRRRPVHRPLAPCAAILAALAVAAPAAAGPRLDKRQFQRRANAVCTVYLGRQKALRKPTTQAGLVPYLKKTIALAGAEAGRLKALKPPPAYARTYAQMLSHARAEAAAATALIVALESHSALRAPALIAQIISLDKQYNHAAATIGLDACAHPTLTG
jgi:hypothetical protein